MKAKVSYLDYTPVGGHPNEKPGSIIGDFESLEAAQKLVETNPNRKIVSVEPLDGDSKKE